MDILWLKSRSFEDPKSSLQTLGRMKICYPYLSCNIWHQFKNKIFYSQSIHGLIQFGCGSHNYVTNFGRITLSACVLVSLGSKVSMFEFI
jgi:hypothetical protein